MPYMNREYADSLHGKTVHLIEPHYCGQNKPGGFTIYWTDGTLTHFDACVEHEKVTRQVTLIVNSEVTND